MTYGTVRYGLCATLAAIVLGGTATATPEKHVNCEGISLLRSSRHADPRLVAVAAPELTHAVLHAEELEMQ
jgi:hypothetical protein